MLCKTVKVISLGKTKGLNFAANTNVRNLTVCRSDSQTNHQYCNGTTAVSLRLKQLVQHLVCFFTTCVQLPCCIRCSVGHSRSSGKKIHSLTSLGGVIYTLYVHTKFYFYVFFRQFGRSGADFLPFKLPSSCMKWNKINRKYILGFPFTVPSYKQLCFRVRVFASRGAKCARIDQTGEKKRYCLDLNQPTGKCPGNQSKTYHLLMQNNHTCVLPGGCQRWKT